MKNTRKLYDKTLWKTENREREGEKSSQSKGFAAIVNANKIKSEVEKYKRLTVHRADADNKNGKRLEKNMEKKKKKNESLKKGEVLSDLLY